MVSFKIGGDYCVSAISNEVKNQILDRAKEGVPVLTLSKEHGVSVKTIYGWLAHLPGGGPSVVEYGKLKRERDALLALVGQLSLKMSKGEKNQAGKRY
ncbi:MAG: hypothetical protein ABH814_02280 [bacterium]